MAQGNLLDIIWQTGWQAGSWRRIDTCTCMAESLHCSSQTITTLLICYQFSSVQSLSRVRLFTTP